MYGTTMLLAIALFVGYIDLSYSQTTLSPTTVSAATASPGPDCSARFNYLVLNPQNETLFINALQAAYITWDENEKQVFDPFYAKIRKVIFNPNASAIKVIKKVVGICKTFGKRKPGQKCTLFNVLIPEWHGTIKQFVKCGDKNIQFS